MESKEWIDGYLERAAQLLLSLSSDEINAAADLLMDTWRRRARVYVFGNGGSAAIASHFAGDLNKGANIKGRHRFRAMALVDNVPAMMAWSNDEGYATGLVEPLRNFVERGDLLVAFSGSGSSTNVLRAVDLGKQAGAKSLGFCGFSGGQLRALCDVSVHVPSNSMEHVEDTFLVLCHALLFALRRCIRQEPPCPDPLMANQTDSYAE